MRGSWKTDMAGGTTARAIASAASACAVSALLVAGLAEPASAGHGAVSYENPTKIAEKKRREKEMQEQGTAPPAQAAPAAAPKTAPAPAVASPAGAWEGNQDRAYAASARQHLSEASKLAEEQIAAGKDAQLTAVAKRILENNKKEMAEIDRWLAAHP